MTRTTRSNFFWLVLTGACAVLLNYDNAFAVTGLPLNYNEVRNLPSWVHLETNPACKGFADDCSTADGTLTTGFSFSETGAGTTGTGGESSFNVLTLPNGNSGLSGQAVTAVTGTESMAHLRLGPGAPDSFRLWVVLDSGTDPNFNSQGRLRVNIRNTTGPPAFTAEGSADSEAEVLPVGTDSLPHRLIEANSNPNANNGIADAWSFLIQGVQDHDDLVIRPTSDGTDKASFAGIMIQPLLTTGARSVTWESANSLVNTTNYTGVSTYYWFAAFAVPEPTSVMLLATGMIGFGIIRRRRQA
jgi:hypothetical protein